MPSVTTSGLGALQMLPLTVSGQPLEISLERLGQPMSLYVPLSKGTLFWRPRRFVVRPDRSAVEKGHAQLHAAFLDPFEEPFPDAQVAPADEGLRRPPPRHQIGRHAAPFRAVLMPPDNRLDRLTQGDWLRLATGPALIDQRLQNRPLIIIQDNSSALLNHPR